MRRVVVTGMGLLTPLGCGVEYVWDRLLKGDSSATKITRFDSSEYSTGYACEIPFCDVSPGKFNPDEWMSPKDRRKVDDFILYGICAADQAVRDAGKSVLPIGVVSVDAVGDVPVEGAAVDHVP